MPYTPQRAGQRDHRTKTPCKLVVAGADSSAFFQPAKHPLDDVPLPVLRAIKQPGESWFGFALHGALRDHWLHAVAVTVLAQTLSIVALVCQQPATTFARPPTLAGDMHLIQERLNMRNIAGLPRRQHETQGDSIGIANQVNFGGQTTTTASQSMI